MSNHVQIINIITQFNVDILLIQYSELLLEQPDISDHINGLEQRNNSGCLQHAKNQVNTSDHS